MSRAHENVVGDQFSPRAKAYVESQVHAQGEDLAALADIARDLSPECAIDVGTGGGHAAYAIAPFAARVIACDLSTEMLEAVSATARARGLDRIETRQAAAERLPFEEAVADLVISRFSVHHWQDADAGLREARRVLKRGASAVFIDAISPERRCSTRICSR